MRTNIEIDDDLMRSALAATGLRTKKAVVEEALKLLVRLQGQERLKELGGKIQWEGDLDEMRRNRSSGLVLNATFADSSVLIDHLRGNPHTHQMIELRRRLGAYEIVIGDLVLMEVLQGIRDPIALRATEQILLSVPMLRSRWAPRRARRAALTYRRLRREGLTPRSSIDVLIANFCIEEGLELLSSDRDHRLMAPILSLQLWEPPLN